MDRLIIGNVIALVGCVLMVIAGFLKKKKHILLVQCFQFGFLGLSNLVLGAITGCVAGVISTVRNIVFSKVKTSIWLKIVIMVVQVLLGFIPLFTGGCMNFIDYFPTVSTATFTWFIDLKSEVALKVVLMLTLVLWVVYDLCYQNYVSLAFDVFAIVSNFVGIIMIRKAKAKA